MNFQKGLKIYIWATITILILIYLALLYYVFLYLTVNTVIFGSLILIGSIFAFANFEYAKYMGENEYIGLIVGLYTWWWGILLYSFIGLLKGKSIPLFSGKSTPDENKDSFTEMNIEKKDKHKIRNVFGLFSRKKKEKEKKEHSPSTEKKEERHPFKLENKEESMPHAEILKLPDEKNSSDEKDDKEKK